MSQSPEIPAEVNEHQGSECTQQLELPPHGGELGPAPTPASTRPSSAAQQTTSWQVEPADRGDRGCQLSGGKSPSEEAIIYFITVTIPPWKPVRSPL